MLSEKRVILLIEHACNDSEINIILYLRIFEDLVPPVEEPVYRSPDIKTVHGESAEYPEDTGFVLFGAS